MELKKEKSCGCIIIDDNKTLLIYEKRRNFWGFPKGHMEPGENEIDTALREVKEEVGLDVEIDTTKRYVLTYIVDEKIEKTTVLYVATPKTIKVEKQEAEVEEAKWVSLYEAVNILTFDDMKDILKKVIETIK